MALSVNHSTRTIQEFLNLYKNRSLNLAPAFQRQSVWNMSDRRLLIQSILDSIPLPAIYLYKQVGQGGKPVYDVIDGKQRLETIFLFMDRGPLRSNDELLVRTSFADDEGGELWNWQELPKAAKHRVLATRLPIIEVEGGLGQIISVFVRINATGKRLTRQEQRHAYYYTNPVLKSAQRLADRYQRYLVMERVVAPTEIVRMKHVEFMAELLLSVNAGQPLNKKAKIDAIISGASLGPADLKQAEARLRHAMTVVEAVLPDLRESRFHQLADFYTLVLLLARYKDEGRAVSAHDSRRNALAGALLTDFGVAVDEVSQRIRVGSGATALQEPFRQYLMTVREGTDTFNQRSAREKVLRGLLDGVFDELDPNRTFNAMQRRILWHASRKKRCQICREEILRWEDLSIDHILPFIRGGKTSLANAAIAHKRCNSSKGAGW